MDTKFPEAVNASPEKRSRGARVSGIDRALQILDFLQAEMKPAGAYAVAKAVGAPLSTVYVIIDLEFPRVGLIRVDAADEVLVRVRDSMQ